VESGGEKRGKRGKRGKRVMHQSMASSIISQQTIYVYREQPMYDIHIIRTTFLVVAASHSLSFRVQSKLIRARRFAGLQGVKQDDMLVLHEG